MARRRNWFSYVKSFFSSDSKSKQEKKEKKRRWLFGKLRAKRSPALPAPSSSNALKEAEDAQSKRALAVAVATAAAAEAAVAAAQAAAEVVRLTATPLSYQRSRESAAVKIQTLFRGYLARRALRALKALVKLQAIARGRAVRRQTNITLKNLQSLIKIQNQARAHRIRMSQEIQARQTKEQGQRKSSQLGETANQKFEEQNGKIWDDSLLSKEEIKAKFISKQEAALKRERALEYAFSHQGRRSTRRHSLPLEKELTEDTTNNLNGRWSWLEEWMGTQKWDKELHDTLPVPSPRGIARDLHERTLKPVIEFDTTRRNVHEQEFRQMNRRSFNRSRHSYIRDDESFSSSPAFPSYMAFTESAKARSRSVSTPKQRVGTKDIYPDYSTIQSSSRVSPFPSICSDASVVKPGKIVQRSPRVRNVPHHISTAKISERN